MWAQHDMAALLDSASDGFMVNLSAVLLLLCRPFASDQDPVKSDQRLFKIDPLYASALPSDDNGVHMAGLDTETRLIPPPPSGEDPPIPEAALPFSFSTELFFMAHKSVELGPKAVHAQLVQLSQTAHRLQRAHQDAVQNGGGGGGSHYGVAEQIQERLDSIMASYLSLKAILLTPEVLALHCQLMAATARWLCRQKQPEEWRPIQLASIPEFVVSNVTDLVNFLNRFCPAMLDNPSGSDFLTLVVELMASPHKLKNPHMRAAMAEMLDALMPPPPMADSDRAGPAVRLGRTELFVRHERAGELVGCLLHVFASIEMTGQGVAFEQKFNYRRPMYAAMKFLWTLKLHRKQFKSVDPFSFYFLLFYIC